MPERDVPDLERYAQRLIRFNPVKKPVVRAIIEWLDLPVGSCGLDVGCGIGLQAMQLAEAVGPNGHVMGLDISAHFVARAGGLAEQSGLSKRLRFIVGNSESLPCGDDTFAWAWSMDCVGYAPHDPLPSLREMARVVKPGGFVALAAWSSQHLLPGYPALEARLNATSSGIAPFAAGMTPERHFLRASGWFAQAGLSAAGAGVFAHNLHAPLSCELRVALAGLFNMRWGGAEHEVAPKDWAEYKRLCDPESPDFIVDCPDYYAFFTYSVFRGMVERRGKVI